MFWPLFAKIHESMPKKRQGGTTRLKILSQAKKDKEVLRVLKHCHRLFLSKTKRCYKKATARMLSLIACVYPLYTC